MNERATGKRGSIKTRLIVIPLVVLFFTIASIGVFSSYFLQTSLLQSMEDNGIFLAERIVANLADNDRALGIVNDLLDNKIYSAAKMVIDNDEDLNSEFLKTMAENLEVAQVSWFNPQGEIVYSNIDEYIGWTAQAGHPIYDFVQSSDRQLIEDIRKDSETDEYLKYGYLKAANGFFVQVGINADKVQALTDSFNYQNFMEEISQDEEIFYMLFMDRNAQIIAHNNAAEIGMVLDDEGSRAAAIEGVPHIQDWYYENENAQVLDVSYPVVIDGEHIGAISLGLSLEHMQENITKNIIFVAVVTVIAFIILGFILYTAAKYVVKIVSRLKEQMKYMEQGDFSKDISENLINKNDELGEISQAINTMQGSVRSVIKNVLDMSQNLAASSEQLTATSQQSAIAADEVARAIEEIANGATEQAKDTETGILSMSELGSIVNKNEEIIKHLNGSAERVNRLKDEGLDILQDLVEKTKINSQSSKEVQQVIINTDASAEKISNASEMIRSIADQTNLLALNAAIEAARAGDAGRGFAVVADEIRKLAEQSNKFTEEIEKVVQDLTSKTLTAVNTMNDLEDVVLSQTKIVDMTNNKFIGIAEALEDMKNAIKEVNASSHEITQKKESIMSIMESLSAISEENAAGTEQASASVEEQTAAMTEIANSSEQLAIMAEKLNDQIKNFTV